jgi:hypothetical protein
LAVVAAPQLLPTFPVGHHMNLQMPKPE